MRWQVDVLYLPWMDVVTTVAMRTRNFVLGGFEDNLGI